MVVREDMTPFVNRGDRASHIKAKEFFNGVNGKGDDLRSDGSVGVLIELGLEMKVETQLHSPTRTVSGSPGERADPGDHFSAFNKCSTSARVDLEEFSFESRVSKEAISEPSDSNAPTDDSRQAESAHPMKRAPPTSTSESASGSPESSVSFEREMLNACSFVIRSGGSSNQGNRPYMEDVHVSIDDLSINCNFSKLNQPSALYGIFDGHEGSYAAHFASENLLRYFLEDPFFPNQLTQAMRCAFQRTDQDLHKLWLSTSETVDSGTTALVVFVLGSNVMVANVGDCRAVLSRRGKVIELSVDQNPKNTKERERIEAAGGFVQEDYLNGLLGVTRALGDWYTGLKSNENPILISEPEVHETTLTDEDEFMIVASDGLWAVFSSQEAIDYARKELQSHNDPQKCSEALISQALKRYATDNLTVVTVCFRPNGPPPIHAPWRPRSDGHRRISVPGILSLKKHLNGC